jgi:hypothetical protein
MQEPPQSTSVSSPSLTPLMQETQAPPMAALGEANAQPFDQQSPGPLHFSEGAPGLAFAQIPGLRRVDPELPPPVGQLPPPDGGLAGRAVGVAHVACPRTPAG